jgi:hypothetical protein
MLYYPVISLTPVFFDRHRGFAMGIAMSGSGAGGLVFAPVTQTLLQHYGAPVTLRILGVWNFVICVAISFVIRPHPAYKPIRPSLALAKRGTFIVQVRTSHAYIFNSRSPTHDPQLFASFFQAAGNIIPLYYLTTYSTYVLGYSPTTASMLLAVNNGVNSISRVAMGILADYAGRQNTLVGCVRPDFPFSYNYNYIAPLTLDRLPRAGHLLCYLSNHALDSCVTSTFPRVRRPLWYGFRRLQRPFAYHYCGNLWERTLLLCKCRHLLCTWPWRGNGGTHCRRPVGCPPRARPALGTNSTADEEFR